MISQQQIDEIIEKNDIGEVIGEYVKLERKGSGYSGLCPFHNEKTPSFSVHEGKQIFKCFGCGKGGNVVNFIMLAENLNYPEALEFLAKRAGIRLERAVSREQEERSRLRNDIYSVNRVAARFFYEALKHAPSAQKYLYDRGLRAETVKQFGLGFAPDSWDALYRHFTQSGAAPDPALLEKAGLITARKDGSGYYDKFRNRIMFPILDVSGNVIAFGGRVLDDSLPKYLNSPETPAYNKGSHLYGLNLAKRSQSERVLIVEGYMDCIALHKAGISWAVASLGTALTQAQARLLKKYFTEAIIGYDADGAGQKATLRGLDILAQAGFRVRVLSLSEADAGVKDPDEFLRRHSAEDLLKAVDASKSLIEYKIQKISEKYPPSSLESKAMFLRASTKILAGIRGEAERDLYAEWFSGTYRISKDALLAELEHLRRGGASSMAEMQESRRVIKNIKTREIGNNTEEETIHSAEKLKLDKLEKTLILLLSDDSHTMERYYAKVRSLLYCERNKVLLERLKNRFDSGGRTGPEAVLSDAADAPEADVSLLTDLIGKWLRPPDPEAACEALIRTCGILNCDRKIACINEMLENAEINEADRAALLKETAAIIEERKNFKNERQT